MNADAKPKKKRITGQAVGAVATVTGAVLTGLGIPGGQLVSSVGQAVTSVSEAKEEKQPSPSGNNNNPYAQILQSQAQQQNAYTNIMNTYQQQMQQISAQQQQQAAANPYADILTNYPKLMEQISAQQQQQAAASPFADIMSNYQKQMQIIMDQQAAAPNPYGSILANYERQMQQIMGQSQTNANPLQQQQAARAPLAMKCPNHHSCVVAPNENSCNACKGAHGLSLPMVGCRQCDWDICYTCADHASKGSTAQVCSSNHKAYHLINVWPGYTCSYCLEIVPLDASVYYCSLCDWGTCGKSACGQKGTRTYPIKCPGNHSASLAMAPVNGAIQFSCDICSAPTPPGTEMYFCFPCNWSVCTKHSEHDDEDDGYDC